MSDDANRSVPREHDEPSRGTDSRARLRAVHPAELRWALELGARSVVVGRLAVEDAIPLRHGTVSRRHFELGWDPVSGHHTGRDLGSHNGSRVDGDVIGHGSVELRDGSVLQLGDVTLVYERVPPGLPPLVLPPAVAPGVELPTRPRASGTFDFDGSTLRRRMPTIPGDAPATELLRQAVARVAPRTTPVLLDGERGTGKQHVAAEIHRRSGRSGPLVQLDCSSLAPHRFDALRLQEAVGGTLLLEEVGALPLPLQPALLQVLQQGETSADGTPVDVRIVATTRGALLERMEAGKLRRDLYASLVRWTLPVPPLRERRGDLLAWIDRLHAAWLEQTDDAKVDTLTLSPEAAEHVLLHPWPDNLHGIDRLVRELVSTPSLPRPIPLQQLPAWLLVGGGSSTPTLPVMIPPWES